MNKIQISGVDILEDTESQSIQHHHILLYLICITCTKHKQRLSPANTSHVTASPLVLVLVWLQSKVLCQLSALPRAPLLSFNFLKHTKY